VIFCDFAIKLIEAAKTVNADDNQLERKLKRGIFALDYSVIDLCLDLC
jgi:hypothetical protein